MRDFTDDIADLRRRLDEARAYLRIEELQARRPQVETEASGPDASGEPALARRIAGELDAATKDIELYEGLVQQVDDAETLAELAREEGDESQEPEIDASLEAGATALD